MTTEDPRNNAPNTRGKPFPKGNPGRPKGARHRASILAEKLLAKDIEDVVVALIKAAKDGDVLAGKAILDKLLPPAKSVPVRLPLPSVSSPAEAIEALNLVIRAATNGTIDPSAAVDIARVVEGQIRAVEAGELVERIERLEEQAGMKK